MKKIPFFIGVIGLFCIHAAVTARAQEPFPLNTLKIEGKSADAQSAAPPVETRAETLPASETAPPQPPAETNASPGFVVPRISGSIARELAETGMAVIHLEFDPGKAELLPAHLPWIDEVHAALVAHPDWKLTIEGHTDRIGRPAWNKKLSLLRTEAVRDELLKRGISPDRLRCIGWGAERPVDNADTMEAYARNRRVELRRE